MQSIKSNFRYRQVLLYNLEFQVSGLLKFILQNIKKTTTIANEKNNIIFN